MKFEIGNNMLRVLILIAIVGMAYLKIKGYGWLIFAFICTLM